MPAGLIPPQSLPLLLCTEGLMTTLAPPPLFTPDANYVASKTVEKDEKLALATLEAVVPAFQLLYTAPITDTASATAAGQCLAAMCEVLWQWEYSTEWPPTETP